MHKYAFTLTFYQPRCYPSVFYLYGLASMKASCNQRDGSAYGTLLARHMGRPLALRHGLEQPRCMQPRHLINAPVL